jgi:hypothetical protein
MRPPSNVHIWKIDNLINELTTISDKNVWMMVIPKE